MSQKYNFLEPITLALGVLFPCLNPLRANTMRLRKIDGCRRLYADLAKRNWYASQRRIRYARYMASLA